MQLSINVPQLGHDESFLALFFFVQAEFHSIFMTYKNGMIETCSSLFHIGCTSLIWQLWDLATTGSQKVPGIRNGPLSHTQLMIQSHNTNSKSLQNLLLLIFSVIPLLFFTHG